MAYKNTFLAKVNSLLHSGQFNSQHLFLKQWISKQDFQITIISSIVKTV